MTSYSETEAPSEDMSEIPLERAEAGGAAASFPSPDELRTDHGGAAYSNGRRSSSSFIIFAAACLVVVALVIGLGVGFSGGGVGTSGLFGGGSSDDATARKFSYEDLTDYLIVNEIATSDTLFSSVSPQAQAGRWLADEDPRNLVLPTSDVSTKAGYHFVTRFILATLFYATDGDNWRIPFNFMSSGDVCGWRGNLFTQDDEPVPFGALCGSNGEVLAIFLDRNELDGTIPSEITSLSLLQTLDLGFNDNIRGSLPPGLNKLTQLQGLDLQRNQLVGGIPPEICELSFLRLLFLGFNQLNGNLPACIGDLQETTVFSVANNMLSGQIPSSLASMVKLQGLYLDDNMLSGDITSMFNEMRSLRGLYLEDNFIQGTIDDNFLPDARLLLQLDMSNNELTGYVPEHFFDRTRFPIFELVDLHNNRLAGVLPSNFTVNLEMNLVSLQGNSIEGNIPETWVDFRGLFHLDLSSNQLTGAMPEHVGNMTLLSYLFLANNSFTPGPVPTSYANLVRMEDFSIKATGRTGPLPEFISEWEALQILDLDQNNFNGPIPDSYGNLTNLEFLLLNRNDLDGQVPTTFGRLSNLRAVFLEQNRLTGNLDVLCDLENFQELVGDADGTEIIAADCLNNAVVCSCCKICCVGSFSDNGLDETTCHDATAIANLNPRWENRFRRDDIDFGNTTRYIDRDFLN